MMISTDTQRTSSNRDVRIERALIEASHILVSTSDANLGAVLRIIAETTSAQCAFILGQDWDDGSYRLRDLIADDILLWHCGGKEAHKAWMDRHRGSVLEDEPELFVAPGSSESPLPLQSRMRGRSTTPSQFHTVHQKPPS